MLMIKANSKINLGLKVVGTDEKDGYHLIDMVTLPIELHDRIEIERLPYGYDTIITCDDRSIPTDEQSIVSKTLQVMQEKYQFKDKLRIHIHKIVPVCSGLGGGSADAAAVLIGLNKMLKLKASIDDLCELGLKVGSDIPFCLKNMPCRVQGKGEVLEPIKIRKRGYKILLCMPNSGLSTREVYKKYDDIHDDLDFSIDELITSLKNDDKEGIIKNSQNDLLKPAISMNEEIQSIINKMKEANIELVSMTGSGACVFGISESERLLEEVEEKLSQEGYRTFLTKTL